MKEKQQLILKIQHLQTLIYYGTSQVISAVNKMIKISVVLYIKNVLIFWMTFLSRKFVSVWKIGEKTV